MISLTNQQQSEDQTGSSKKQITEADIRVDDSDRPLNEYKQQVEEARVSEFDEEVMVVEQLEEQEEQKEQMP